MYSEWVEDLKRGAKNIVKKLLGLKRRARLNPHMFRPFSSQDLSPLPKDWSIRGPDWIGIGYPKAGTSWWWKLLLDHPQVVPNRLDAKELSYFPHFTYHGIDEPAIRTYRNAFAAPDGCICGEWSPHYLVHPLSIQHLARTAPAAKLLVTVRNPVESVLSTLNQLLSARALYLNLPSQPEYLLQTFSLFPEAISNHYFRRHFSHLLKLFDPSQLLILQYEDCREQPQENISRTCRFLGIDDSYIPSNMSEKVNTIPYVIQPLKPVERASLANYFRDDVYWLAERFPQIEVSLWADFEV